ncbi:Predicted kinase, aminoglycoside phosphotransferase (APT) family [Halomicrobium zhouii]|uniref:Predicted kinase, aminoglycoside phosphotransferase (APT) family n=1 Tax=Halomicrobium zhouii TaxID=767519 RepID=A0A1I6LPM2_9EURY|nr:phosphotransferase [Halomicrobium zhouii]SFS05383.1 Predicted kinase, aminoglycoside phosphotransferase (APT) family [Halomicrobium zhouii]
MSSPVADLEAVLAESGPDYTDFTFERPTGGHQSDVFMVTLEYAGEEYEVVVKFEPPEMASFAVEPKIHDFVAERSDVPVPEILVFEQEPVNDVPPYFITTRLEGQNLAEGFGDLSMDVRQRAVAQVGRMLGDLHSEIAFEAFGWLDLWQERIIVRDLTGSWREYFEQLIGGHVDALAETPFADVAERARERIEPALALVPEDGVPRLVHDDFRPANLLFDASLEEPITAVLDWQDVLAAHPEYHLAQTEFLFIDSAFQDPAIRDRLRETLHDGYREERAFAFDDGYEERRPLYQLSTLLWRMGGFEDAFADDSGLARARAEAQYRQQFERLVESLPRP